MVRVECLLLQKEDANVLPTATAYPSVPQYGHCILCTVLRGVYRDTMVHWCISLVVDDKHGVCLFGMITLKTF